MALSLLSQHQQQPNYFDLQTLFDPYPLQQHQQQNPQYPHNYHQHQELQLQQQQQQYNHQLHIQQQQQQQQLQHLPAPKSSGINVSTVKTDPTTEPITFCPDQMEYTGSNLHQNHNHYQQQQSRNSNENINNTNNNNINNNSSSNNRKTNNITQINNNSQILNKTNRYYANGYSQHQVTSDYVITFVDSPPNSEESWTDEHSKESPGPQIIDVQTIYSNSGSRKRRMDWDSLDIGQSGNTTTAQAGELSSKITHHDKDKVKKDKTIGRGSWTEDIGFDLNTDFNSNSYLSNESFLSFSPALTVLKQEPQSDQLKANKSPLNTHAVVTGGGGSVPKLDKAPTHIETAPNSEDTPKNALNNTICVCGSPKPGTPQEIEPNGNNIDKSKANASNAFGNVGSAYSGGEKTIASQQLTEVDGNKIENSTGGVAVNGNNTNAHSDDHKFQYILAAATSIATKNNEETLTYLNQGQSYEIKLKKIGDLSFYRDKILKSVIKICFHERRLQFMEREQMQQWQASRPGERIIEVDVPLSYGLCHVSQPLNPNFLNTVEIFWDPLKEVGVYIKVNCISTEFTPKKHGGEKGVPFRLQIETYIESTNSTGGTTASPISTGALSSASASVSSGVATAPTPIGINITSGNNNSLVSGKQPVHAAACQIKVFKLKGADRKHKQDREKIQRRTQAEQDKFQPSYECTIMNDIPLDILAPTTSGCFSPEYMKIWPNSPVHIPKYDGILSYTGGSPVTNSSPIAINSVTSTNSPTLKLMEANMVSPQQSATLDMDDYAINILPESSPNQVAQWLSHHRLTSYLSTFAHFSGSDIMRMSKEDLIQICGLADGIRMFNILRAKAIAPRLTLYVSLDGNSYNAIYLLSNTSKELMQKLCKMPGFYEMIVNGNTNGALENGSIYSSWGMHSKYSGSGSNIFNDSTKNFIFLAGPSGVHVNVTDEVLNNEVKDGSLYTLEVQNSKVVMKLINKNDN